MTTKRKLKEALERANSEIAQTKAKYDAVVESRKELQSQLEKVQKGIITLKCDCDSYRDQLTKNHDAMSCVRCDHIDENGKKLHPQKCACCRRGAKDNYTAAESENGTAEDTTTADNRVMSDFLKKSE